VCASRRAAVRHNAQHVAACAVFVCSSCAARVGVSLCPHADPPCPVLLCCRYSSFFGQSVFLFAVHAVVLPISQAMRYPRKFDTGALCARVFSFRACPLKLLRKASHTLSASQLPRVRVLRLLLLGCSGELDVRGCGANQRRVRGIGLHDFRQ
jgi:hypothetical protein